MLKSLLILVGSISLSSCSPLMLAGMTETVDNFTMSNGNCLLDYNNGTVTISDHQTAERFEVRNGSIFTKSLVTTGTQNSSINGVRENTLVVNTNGVRKVLFSSDLAPTNFYFEFEEATGRLSIYESDKSLFDGQSYTISGGEIEGLDQRLYKDCDDLEMTRY